MTITYHKDIIQGSPEWFNIRCGILTASEMKNIITPAKLDPVKNPAHLYELLAQRINGYVEPSYINDDMLRGMTDEIDAKALYSGKYDPIDDIGFITNDKWGFTIGYSPDGLVWENGLVEIKSRRQKFQIETIIDMVLPDEYKIQCQTGLLVSEREWLDFISYCAGMPMLTIRVFPDADVQKKIVEAAEIFEGKIQNLMTGYNLTIKSEARLIPTERKKPEQQMLVTGE